MSNTATEAPNALRFQVHRTRRNTWHVIDQLTGAHWEAMSEAHVRQSVQDFVDNIKKAEEERIAAQQRMTEPRVADFSAGVPDFFDRAEPAPSVAQSGKAVAPATADPAGAAPEPETVAPGAGTITLTDAQFQALLARGQGAEPEPEEVQPIPADAPDVTTPGNGRAD